MFRRKYEFKPDRTDSGILNKLYLTKQQRKTLFKWVLLAAALVVLSLLQDVVLSRVRIFGATLDLVACGILLCCMLFDPDVAAVFGLVSSMLYYFSGSAPGVYSIALLTALGVLLCIFRRSYLQRCFSATFLCTAVGVLVYELTVFAIGLFLGNTFPGRFGVFCLCGVLSVAAIPVLYPVFLSISNLGGESWKE